MGVCASTLVALCKRLLCLRAVQDRKECRFICRTQHSLWLHLLSRWLGRWNVTTQSESWKGIRKQANEQGAGKRKGRKKGTKSSKKRKKRAREGARERSRERENEARASTGVACCSGAEVLQRTTAEMCAKLLLVHPHSHFRNRQHLRVVCHHHLLKVMAKWRVDLG